MELKYRKEIQNFECNLSKFKEIEREAFRWTFEEINDVRNFEPVYINDPRRRQESCFGFALSFYESKQSGIKKHRELTLNRPNIYKKLGTHISSGTLSKSDGIAGETNENKHFEFFTYETVELKHKFTVLESLV